MRQLLYRLDGKVKMLLLLPASGDTVMVERPNTRERILKAASELAYEAGPGNLSLDAVAARAGLSKGGLLYNFPSKASLLEALVENHLAEFETELAREEACRESGANALASAYVAVLRRKHEIHQEPPAGVIAALAENPGFLDPIRRFNRSFLNRIVAAEEGDKRLALIAFLAMEGLRTSQLMGIDVMTPAERGAILDSLEDLLG